MTRPTLCANSSASGISRVLRLGMRCLILNSSSHRLNFLSCLSCFAHLCYRTLGGMSTSADIVEWILAENGVFQTELEEDPRLKIQKMKIKRTGTSGVPVFLFPIIVAIEIISFLSRPVSLSVRLFANMLAGHTMLKVFGGFVVSLGIVGGWLPLSFSVALTALEILVAFLQAYVFAVLSCIYLNDALHMHH